MPQEKTRVKLGYQSRVRITARMENGTLESRYFGVRGMGQEAASDEHECGDSESGIHKRHKYGRGAFALTMDFYEKDSANLHDPPTSPTAGGWGIKNGDYVGLEIWTQGQVSEFGGAILNPYMIPWFGVGNVSLRWGVDGKIEGSITGKSDGDWFRPGETTETMAALIG